MTNPISADDTISVAADLATLESGNTADIGTLTGVEQFAVAKGAGLFQTTLTKIGTWIINTFQGFTQSGTGAMTRTMQSKLTDIVNAADFGVLPTNVSNSAAFQQMINTLESNVVINVGPGSFTFNALYTILGTNQGTAVNFGLTTANITIRGAGIDKTIFKPASNMVEMFSVLGTNIAFEDITFDNTANGLLQNVLMPSNITQNGGLAGLGNHANAAIVQYTGGGTLTLRRLKFLQFNMCCHYYGDYTTQANLVGDLIVDQIQIDTCCFGVLAEQPNRIMLTNSWSRFTQNSNNAAGSSTTTDPGHLMYVTNRNGASPILVSISNIAGYNDINSIVQVRKGVNVVVNGVNVNGSGRGAAFVNINHLSIANYSASIVQMDPTDTLMSALELNDVSNYVIDSPVLNVAGAPAYGLRLSPSTNPTNDMRGRVVCPTVIGDWTSGSLSPFYVNGQTDTIIDRPVFMHVGSNAGAGNWPINVTGGTRVRIMKPSHILVGGAATAPADAAYIVSLDSTSVNCTVELNDAALSYGVTYVNGNTVHDSSGTAQIIGPYGQQNWGVNGAITAGTTAQAGATLSSSGQLTVASAGIAATLQRLATDGVFMRIYGIAGGVIGQWQSSGTTTKLSLDSSNSVFFTTMNGSPSGVLTAGVGSICVNRGGSAGSILWVKQSGTDASGWVAIA